MIDFYSRSSHFAAVFHSPGRRIEPRVNGARRAAAVVQIHRAKPNDGTERALPGKARQRDGDVRIALEFHSCGARRGLELVHGQLPDEAHAVIAQTPSGIVVIRGSREGTPAKNQQISAMLKKRVNGGPILLGERDRKSTRLNSSHGYISYAVFCLKKKKKTYTRCKVSRQVIESNKVAL